MKLIFADTISHVVTHKNSKMDGGWGFFPDPLRSLGYGLRKRQERKSEGMVNREETRMSQPPLFPPKGVKRKRKDKGVLSS